LRLAISEFLIFRNNDYGWVTMKKEFFKSILWSLSFASLVFAFQNCSNPFKANNAFHSNVKTQTLQTPVLPETRAE